MEKELSTFTNTEELDLNSEISMLETTGNVKPIINKKNSILIGAWIGTLIVTSSLSSVNNYNIFTSLQYPNKNTQANIYDPKIIEENLAIDDEINNELFVRTKPESSFSTELEIDEINEGKPIIET